MIEDLHLSANGLQFRALADGPESGARVLLLHGFPVGAESWAAQLAGLAERGFRAVAPDLRGYGGTDCPPAEDDYRLELLVADVAGLLDALEWDAAHVVGHDWGSLVGWPFVSQHADRVLSWTSLSVGHPVALSDAVRGDADQQARSSYILLLRQPGKAEAVLSENGHERLRQMYRLGPNPDAIPDSVIERYVESFSRPGRLTAALNYYRAALPSIADAMGPVAAPTLLVWGDQDPALGRTAVDATAGLVAGPYKLQVLEGAGHWLQFERGSEVTELIATHCQGAQRR